MKAGTYTLGIILAAWWGFAGTPVQAQTTANGPYYATPSWDQTLPSATRFIVLSNFASQAVLDRETGLVWERTPDPAYLPFWQEARTYCLDKNVGGRRGWRLPSVSELMSLLDPAVASGLRLPAGHPFNVNVTVYWSMTSNATLPQFAFAVTLTPIPDTDFFLTNGPKSGGKLGVWCVRGGAVLDNY